ncbi:hypothetical protein [Chlamydiifrater phoenicopteri]|uniref:TmeB family type III secretion system effector n=1 Tax=Chlamydiifrater phoenicopteri TaxID=2681469 RepID=UPI001BCFF878|nr:hypothetical protein [Chlamydiifrater phoenicopteri]
MVSGIPPRGDDSRFQSEDVTSPKFSSSDESSDSMDEIEELDNRISECAGEVFETQEGTPKTQGYASEYDLRGRVEQEVPTGFFRSLIRRIFSIARRVWGAIRRYCYCSGRKTTSRETSHEGFISYQDEHLDDHNEEVFGSQGSSSSQDSLVQYNRRLKAGFARVVLAPLKFKAPAHSKESVVATAKLMLQALGRVDEIKSLFLGIPLESETKKSLIQDLSENSMAKWKEIESFYEKQSSISVLDPASSIPAMRALLKLCMAPTFSVSYEASDMMTSLSDFDPLRSYESEKLLAQLLQEFATGGEDERLLVKDLLFGLREKFVRELESLISKISEAYPSLDQNVIDNTVDANAATIAKAYYHDDVAFDKQLNAVVKRFFRGWKKLDFSLLSS